MTNSAIADHFSLLSKLMEIHGENSFKSKSYGITAFTIEKLPNAIETMDEAELSGIKGIGDATGKKIKELLTTGKLPQLEQLLAATPAGILEIMELKGLGPKKVSIIWKELGIETPGELEYACNENRLMQAKGFGAKTQESILQNIAYLKQNLGLHLWAEVYGMANAFLNQLQRNHPQHRFALTGDIRRQNETLEYIDIVTDIHEERILSSLGEVSDEMITTEAEDRVVVAMPGQPKIRFHLSDEAGYYRTLFVTTGGEEFMSAFLKQYTIPDSPDSEEAIFSMNGLAFIPAAMRETAGALEQAAQHALPKLIEPEDIRGIIHSHSTWSDGTATIEQMAVSAAEKGFEYLVLSDHSQAAFYANGLTPERIAAQHGEIDALNAKLAPFRIFKSIEADILNDGRLDYSNSVLNTFDLVIASVHSNLKMSEEKAMDRVLAAVRNPFTTILGHPTGRLLLSRKGYPIDHKRIIDACAEHDVVIEINAHPRRLDLDWRWIGYALERGVLLSVDPDAHSVNGFHDVFYGVMAAQKGGLTARQNLSSYTLKEFEAFLAQYRLKKGGNS